MEITNPMWINRTRIVGFFIISCTWILISCHTPEPDPKVNIQIGSTQAFSEMVAAGVKKMALSPPMSPAEMDKFYVSAMEVANRHSVEVFREDSLLITDLFPEDVAKGKEVLVIYRGNTLAAYEKLKADKASMEDAGRYDTKARIEIARRFGRLLSYSPRAINRLLAGNTKFRTMDDFSIRASNIFLYYKDLPAATQFYTHILGLELVAVYDNASLLRIAETSYVVLVDAAKGMHSADEPKTVAIALVTDQLEAWYQYLTQKEVEIKYPFKPQNGGPHDGFVAIDPEGYLLEFERFNQHPENEDLIPILMNNKTILARSSEVPEGLGFKSSVTWVYYKDVLAMEDFYQNVLGLEKVADQGWTKIYRVTDTGFIGLVDERRGMHSFTEEKAVTVSFIIDGLDGWFDYVNSHAVLSLRSDSVSTGPDGRYRAFVAFDPEGYYLEFDRFYEHQDNSKLMYYLGLNGE